MATTYYHILLRKMLEGKDGFSKESKSRADKVVLVYLEDRTAILCLRLANIEVKKFLNN